MNSTPKTENSVTTPDGIIPDTFYDHSDIDNTPYISDPTSLDCDLVIVSPFNYFYSAPSSPMHHLLKTSASSLTSDINSVSGVAVAARSSFEFDFGFSGSVDDDVNDDCLSRMSSADELFLNGQIRPMKLSSHLQQTQNLAPLIDVEDEDDEEEEKVVKIEVLRGRDLKQMRNRSLRRKTRSLSPLRTDEWNEDKKEMLEENSKIENPVTSSSGGTSSKRWVFLKDFIRSKSDGSNTNNGSRHTGKFWSSLSFHHKCGTSGQAEKHENLRKTKLTKEELSQIVVNGGTNGGSKLRNGIEIRRSAHEAHYTAKRAQAEEMRRKTYLPYRQGLLGCLGFSSKGYGAMDGFTRALKSVSSR